MYSKGIMWLDDCRIPFVDEGDKSSACNKNHEQGKYDTDFFEGYYKRKGSDTKGRFTPNLLVCDDMLNDGVIGKSSSKERKNKLPQNIYGSGKGIPPQTSKGFDDKGTNSRYYDLDLWFDKMLEKL